MKHKPYLLGFFGVCQMKGDSLVYLITVISVIIRVPMIRLRVKTPFAFARPS